MATSTALSAPYAPPAAVIMFIERYRDRGLSGPFDVSALERAGIKGSVAARTMQALRFLGLLDEGGNATPVIQGLRTAPSDGYQERLAAVIKSAYRGILEYVDPAEDSEDRIRDAFRSYEPAGQQARMVTLFLSLCEAAGMRQAGKQRKGTHSASRAPRKAPVVRTNPKAAQRNGDSGGTIIGGDYPIALRGLLDSLREHLGGWTEEERDKFLTTLKVVLDYCIPVVEEEEEEGPQD